MRSARRSQVFHPARGRALLAAFALAAAGCGGADAGTPASDAIESEGVVGQTSADAPAAASAPGDLAANPQNDGVGEIADGCPWAATPSAEAVWLPNIGRVWAVDAGRTQCTVVDVLDPTDLTVTADAVWAVSRPVGWGTGKSANPAHHVVHIDPATAKVVKQYDIDSPQFVRTLGDDIVVATWKEENRAVQVHILDAATGKRRSVDVAAGFIQGLAVTDGAAWVVVDENIYRVDLPDLAVASPIAPGDRGQPAIVSVGDDVWAYYGQAGELVRVEGSSASLSDEVVVLRDERAFGGTGNWQHIAAAHGRIWLIITSQHPDEPSVLVAVDPDSGVATPIVTSPSLLSVTSNDSAVYVVGADGTSLSEPRWLARIDPDGTARGGVMIDDVPAPTN